jgi:hypothetical protein
LEQELANNVSFMNFLGFPETILDSTTFGSFELCELATFFESMSVLSRAKVSKLSLPIA